MQKASKHAHCNLEQNSLSIKKTISNTNMAEAAEVKRPSRTSMEGMIWNANHVLEQALLPANSGIPQAFFKTCVGVVLVSVVEVGFIFSGNVGTGILLKKNSDDTWSAPVACGMSGVGWGLLVGGSVKDIMIFIFDEATMNKIGYDKMGLKLGAQGEATIGPIGRAHKFDISVAEGGVGTTVSVAFSKGAFLGLSVEGAIVGPRTKVNDKFYGKATNAADIMSGLVEFPSDKVTLISDVYDKLEKLSKGVTATPDATEAEKKTAAAAVAEQSAAEVQKEEDVEEVDAKAKAEAEAKSE